MKRKKIITIVFLLIVLFMCTINTYAADLTIDPDDYKPNDININDIQEIINMSSIIVTAIRTIGATISVVVLLVLGIKYMMGSVEERADYKKSMIPYVVGTFIFFGITQFLAIIIQMVEYLET